MLSRRCVRGEVDFFRENFGFSAPALDFLPNFPKVGMWSIIGRKRLQQPTVFGSEAVWDGFLSRFSILGQTQAVFPIGLSQDPLVASLQT